VRGGVVPRQTASHRGTGGIGLADIVAGALEKGIRAMHRFAEDNDSAIVDFPDVEIGGVAIDPFLNVNTPADLETARALFSKPPGREPARG